MKKLLTLLIVGTIYGVPLKVAIHEFPPCIIIDQSKRGFDIDIWEHVADRLGIKYQYIVVDEFREIIPGICSGKYDLAIAGITIRDDREEVVDFSHPYMKSGLGILVKSEERWGYWYTLKSFIKSKWLALLNFMMFITICAIVIYWLERGQPSFDDDPIRGLGDGLYWANTTITTVGYGDKTPLTRLGKVFAVVVMWVGIYGMAPYITASMATMMTTQEMRYTINDKHDLSDKKIATVQATSAVETLWKLNANVRTQNSAEGCYKALVRGEVDAFVFDMPLLKYMTSTREDNIIMVKCLFDPQDYGIVLPQGSPLREKINIELLKLIRSDKYEAMQNRWFK